MQPPEAFTLAMRSRLSPATGCWVRGPCSCCYTSLCYRGGPSIQAHRWAYQQFVGPIPDGLELDHKCEVRACWRPDHLEAVTRSENHLRSFRRTVPHPGKPDTWLPLPQEALALLGFDAVPAKRPGWSRAKRERGIDPARWSPECRREAEERK